MPSSPNPAALMSLPTFDAGTAVIHASDGVRAVTWQPEAFSAAATAPQHQVPDAFEPTNTDGPRWASFEVSPEVGIPDDVLEAARATARAAGYATGWAAGVAEAKAASDQQLTAQQAAFDTDRAQFSEQRSLALAALAQASVDLSQRAVTSAADVEDHIISLAFNIAEALVGDVMKDDMRRAHAALQRALKLAPQDHDVTVNVSPQDFAALAEAAPAATSPHGDSTPTIVKVDDTLRQRRGAHEVVIVSDVSLAAGDAVAKSNATTIDARLSSALGRVREVIGL